ncbi:uncharacterized protein LOC115266460 isoform X2 [Aedes albopictus]|uniref:NACHT domain-containing protein n=1 Tax=Aedes albopictus TaxID=7160 RepID=A0ABM1Z7G0_AEDAL|nr:uncharacterized protein LOC109427082 isoform X2 [Aedes albopictus]XP_029728550.1 uncharacterized protein LOC115266460 isoform X2 [Aedes albopictus]
MRSDSDSQQTERYLVSYLLCRARAKAVPCSIGRHILQSKHFDDIYCEVESPERSSLYLFDVKKHRYKSKRISFSKDVKLSYKCTFDIRRYFEAYLQIKQQLDKPIQELAVWCSRDFKRNEFASESVQVVFIEERNVNDLIETFEIGIRKARIKPNALIEKELAEFNHPLYKLAFTIATLMFQKSVISLENLSKSFYVLLLKDVFEDENHFKEEFTQPSKNICGEAKQFHDMLELVLSEQFRQRNILDFHQLLQIEQKPFAELVEVKIIYDKSYQKYFSDATWHVDYNVSLADVQQFLSILVFYSNAPTKNQFGNMLQRYCDTEMQSLIEKIYEKGVLVQSSYLDKLIKVLNTEKSDRQISFTADSLKELDKAVLMRAGANSSNKLITEAGDTANISDARIISILEKSTKHFSIFDELTDDTKEKLLSTVVLLQGRYMQLSALLSEQAMATIPMAAVSDWSQGCYQQIVIGQGIETPELELHIAQSLKTDKNSNLDPSQTTFESLSILCALPGAGKSTLLKQMAVNFSEKHDDHIMLLADFKQILGWFNYTNDLAAFILKLLNINSDGGINQFIVHKMLEDRRIILLLDGFDEVNSTKEEIVVFMLDLLRQANLHLIMIATRPHRLEVLQQHLGDSTVYNILPFTENEQLQFLQQRLSSVSSNESTVANLIKTFRWLFDDEHLLHTPLHSEILAAIYEEDCTVRSIDHWNAAETLQRFIDKKFEVFADKFFDRFNRAHESALQKLKKTFEADYSELAFRLQTHQTIDQKTFSQLEPYGMLQINNSTISFINAVFVEFFVAQFIVRHQVDQQQFNLYMSEHLSKSKFSAFLEYHIGKADTHHQTLQSTPSLQNTNLKELRCLQQHKLHIDKIKQWHLFFVECSTVEQQLEYLRRSIAKAEFNTFQVIYESLPNSLVDELCFKFAPSIDNPFRVDLTKMSEEHLLQLLKILHQEHPQDVARKHISSFNNNEDDFVTMAIKRDHRSVIEQLFHMEQNLTDEDESDLLLGYMKERWRHYLQLTAQYRKGALLKQTLELIAKRFHQRVIKYFLMNCNIQCVLIESFKEENVDAEVFEGILTFIEQHLSGYDLQILLNRNVDGWLFVEKLEDLQNSRVRELCESLWNSYQV